MIFRCVLCITTVNCPGEMLVIFVCFQYMYRSTVSMMVNLACL
jgi:hypothetical protein